MVFNTKKANTIFATQLGTRIDITSFEQILKLPNEYRALMVPMLTQIDGFYEDEVGKSSKWLKQYALSFLDVGKAFKSLMNPGKPELIDELPPLVSETLNMTGVDEALKKAWDRKSTRDILTTSAYLNVLIVQLMMRTVSIKSSHFKWLKPMNRTLWYGLNNVGRPRTFHIEGAGIIAHAEYEMLAKRKEYVPEVDRVTKGLRLKLKQEYFING